MKSKKILYFITLLLLILIVIIFLVYQKGETKVSDIEILGSMNKIEFQKIITVQDETDLAHNFKELIDSTTVLLLTSNDSIEIKFEKNPPSEAQLYDYYIYKESGKNKYGNAQIRNLEINENIYSFKIGTNSAELLESDLSKPKYRGFRLICQWDNFKCEYLFVIRLS